MKIMLNKVTLAGEVVGQPELYKKLRSNTCLFKIFLEIERTSGETDIVPCIVKEKYLPNYMEGNFVKITGRLMTNNVYRDGVRRLDVYTYVDGSEEFEAYENYVEFEGIIGKKSEVRTTPFKRKIIDLTLIGKLHNGISSYVPSIAWFDNAYAISELNLGDVIFTTGRLQSREYVKNEETRIAFEYSINFMTQVKGDENDECEN